VRTLAIAVFCALLFGAAKERPLPPVKPKSQAPLPPV